MNHIRGDKNLEQKAKWEIKSDNAIKKGIMRNAVEDMRKRKATDLKARKQRLAELLAQEDAVYEQEFMNSLETPQ
jgi:hypothetical protein